MKRRIEPAMLLIALVAVASTGLATLTEAQAANGPPH